MGAATEWAGQAFIGSDKPAMRHTPQDIAEVREAP